MDMRFGTWNIRSFYRASSLKTVARELIKYNLDPVAEQEDRWDEGGGQPADNYTSFYGNGNAKHHLETGFFVHKGIVSAVKRVEFISDRMSYITLRGRWCGIVSNAHSPTKGESDDTKDSFFEEL
jgi:hypothetical protein